jgi:probable HAF family extracellular repeat protein
MPGQRTFFGSALIIVVAIISLISAGPVLGASSLTDLGVLPGYSTSTATGISADGTIVVGWSADSAGHPRAFYWSTSTGMVDLVGLNNVYSKALAISRDSSTIVGTWSDSTVEQYRGFSWTAGSGMVDLGILTGAAKAAAYAVSSDGTVIAGGPGGAWLWTAGGGMVSIGGDCAYAMSADGGVLAGGTLKGWYWTEAGGFVPIGNITGAANSAALTMSSDGSVIAGQSNTAFRWTAPDGMVNLGTLGTTSSALAMSDDGGVVVGVSTNSNTNTAFRWTESGGMISVASWLTGHGVTVSGTLTSADAVSANGYAVAGQNSSNHAYLAVVDAQGLLTVTRSGTGTGSVTSSPAGIACGDTCSYTFPEGTVVTLTATADSGSTFQSWTGCATTSGATCTVTLTASATVSAVFGHNATLAVATTGNGSGAITSSPAGINCGSTCSHTYGPGANVTLTATAEAGSQFSAWTGCPSASGNVCSMTLTADTSVSAAFALIHTLTVSKTDGSRGGRVSSLPGGIDCSGGCKQASADYIVGSTVSLRISMPGASDFLYWTGGCSGHTPLCVVTMAQDVSVGAVFVASGAKKYNVSVSKSKKSGGDGIVETDDGIIRCGNVCKNGYHSDVPLVFTATPASGSVFAGWLPASLGCEGADPSCSIIVKKAVTAQAVFIGPQKLTVQKTKVRGGDGWVRSLPKGVGCDYVCSAQFQYGSEVTLTATANAYSTFTAWKPDSLGCSGPTCLVTMDKAQTVKAIFTRTVGSATPAELAADETREAADSD